MARTINITCRYYLIKTYTETNKEAEALYDLRKWFEVVNGCSLSERIKELGSSGKGRLDDIKNRDDFYALNFVRMESYSSTYTVTKDECAKHVDIAIENDEYIGKNTVAIYDAQKSILMLMSNQGGFSPNTITTYVNSFFDKPVCVLEPIKFKKDFTKTDNKFGKIAIKISSVNDFVPTHNAAYEDALNQARAMSASTLSFEFSVGRKKNEYLDANVVRTIISDAFSNMGAVSIARVKMEDEEGTAFYNLFENVKNCVLTLEADANGEIAYETIANAMVNSYY